MLTVGYIFTPQIKDNRRDAIPIKIVLNSFCESLVTIFLATPRRLGTLDKTTLRRKPSEHVRMVLI